MDEYEEEVKCPFITKLEKKIERVENDRYSIKCPFANLFYIKWKCTYMDRYGRCLRIDVCPSNGDAWCHSMLNKAVEAIESSVDVST